MFEISNSELSSDRDNGVIAAIVNIQKKMAAYQDSIFNQANMDNLNYSYEKIKPTRHGEWALVVACSIRTYPMHHIVDEYARRKEGDKPLLPDHLIFLLTPWCVPDTYRIPIFREQLIALYKELTGPSHANMHAMETGFRRHSLNLVDFHALLGDNTRTAFTEHEIRTIHAAVVYYHENGGFAPYGWCSVLAERAIHNVAD